MLDRATGTLLGQLAGDAVGSVVEFLDPEVIAQRYPGGVDMVPSPTWQTLAGQPTDDSELALDLAWTLAGDGVRGQGFPDHAVAGAYGGWLASRPFDCGRTITRALSVVASGGPQPALAARAAADRRSEANGAMMRQSPLGIWGWRLERGALVDAVTRDCSLTHPNPVCLASSAVYVVAIAAAIRDGLSPAGTYALALDTAAAIQAPASVREALRRAETAAPVCHGDRMGHVIRALQNAFYQLLHAKSLEDGVRATVMLGGDTDTNAAIAGALLGAVHGEGAVPERWRRTLRECRADAEAAGVQEPRPERYWPASALSLPARLLDAGEAMTHGEEERHGDA